MQGTKKIAILHLKE